MNYYHNNKNKTAIIGTSAKLLYIHYKDDFDSLLLAEITDNIQGKTNKVLYSQVKTNKLLFEKSLSKRPWINDWQINLCSYTLEHLLSST